MGVKVSMICMELAIPPLPQFVTAGHTVWRRGEQHFARSFDVYDIIFVKSGTLYMAEADIPYEVNAGEVLILSPGQVHFGHRASETETEMYWIHLLHRPPVRLLDQKDIQWNAVLRSGTSKDITPPEHLMYLPKHAHTDFQLFQPLLDQLVKLQMLLTIDHSLEAHSLMIQTLSVLQHSVCRQLSAHVRNVSERIIDYLKRSMAEPFRAKDMESELHFQYDYMTRCFKKYTGLTPVKYLQHLRVEKAKTLLENTDLPIRRIGEMVGIQDVNYFVRLFGEIAGATPTKYRLSRRGFI